MATDAIPWISSDSIRMPLESVVFSIRGHAAASRELAACSDSGLLLGSARPLPWPDVPTHLVERETTLCDGLTLIPTPGHTPGHLSVLVTLPQGPVILAGDAINRASEPAEGFPDAMDPVTAATSAAHLHGLRDRLGAALIWGHDPAQWTVLPKAPLPYCPA